MNSISKLAASAALGFALLAATGASAENKPEDVLKLRQGVMQAVKSQFAPMGAVVKGEAEFSPATAELAANLAVLAKIAPMGWAEGSPAGKTKDEAFASADFKGGWMKFKAETAKLAEVAATGDKAAFAGQFKNVAGTCKGCHDNFKKD